MNVMMIGDICGQPGRRTAAHYIPLLKKKYNLDLIIANGENSAGGVGITAHVLEELLELGIDCITTGNHVWDKKEVFNFIDTEKRLIRPANYPPGTPGKGYHILSMNNYKIAVINLLGRVFMPPIDCPFRTADQILSEIKDRCEIIIIDFHAEATSEKLALGYYLDGQVSCIVGTHTHIQTADERILPEGTAFISDIGMVGSWNSILGVDKEPVIQKFLTGLPTKFTVASGSETIFCAVIIKIDPSTNKISEIIRIQENLKF
ncbi:TIGR00282 family metallophosphoesterase [Pelosinus baikalensis]|uniref:TIGR00282 family metallophosphoesterase n=1 Tax=Pelosinus baikalensis TaxID=2892015 RepID=A0ABS8HMR2_9FIRM|nr:TIGR00282 family metallophosphoesterase [Pelosinus baikalensis]MCC5464465.1 TIGR00282 family metallophosphoesterase [Pelosinus baikalensis]